MASIQLIGSSSGGDTTVYPAETTTTSGVLILPEPNVSVSYSLALLGAPQSGAAKTSSYTLTARDEGLMVIVETGGSIVVNNNVFLTPGATTTVVNNSSSNVTMSMGITTAYIAGNVTDLPTIAISPRGIAKITFLSPTACVVTGDVFSPIAPVPVIGSAYQGGYFAGQISTAANGVADYNLVICPSVYEFSGDYGFVPPVPLSDFDGYANTVTLDGFGAYAATNVMGLNIGGYTDWYIPSRYEFNIVYYNLKPTTGSNSTGGISSSNPYAVPPRPSDFTSGDPAQTTAVDFQDPGPQALLFYDSYWTSSNYGGGGNFIYSYVSDGYMSAGPPFFTQRVRAIRKVPV